MPEPLQPSAAEPTAAKPETYTGIFVPAHPVSAPCAVLVAAAAPTAMAGPSAQPAAMQESFVATSGATQGAGGGSAADHQLQRHPSLCTDPEGSSSSGGAESAPPASSEEEVSEGAWFQPPLLHSCPARQSGLQWLASTLLWASRLWLMLCSLKPGRSLPCRHKADSFRHALLQCHLGHALFPARPLVWRICRPQQALLPLWTCLMAADAGQ